MTDPKDKNDRGLLERHCSLCQKLYSLKSKPEIRDSGFSFVPDVPNPASQRITGAAIGKSNVSTTDSLRTSDAKVGTISVLGASGYRHRDGSNLNLCSGRSVHNVSSLQ